MQRRRLFKLLESPFGYARCSVRYRMLAVDRMLLPCRHCLEHCFVSLVFRQNSALRQRRMCATLDYQETGKLSTNQSFFSSPSSLTSSGDPCPPPAMNDFVACSTSPNQNTCRACNTTSAIFIAVKPGTDGSICIASQYPCSSPHKQSTLNQSNLCIN